MGQSVEARGQVNQAAFLGKTGLLQADLGVWLVSAHDLYDTPHFGSVIPYQVTSPRAALEDVIRIVQDRLSAGVAPAGSLATRRAATLAAMDKVAQQFERAHTPLTLVYHPTISEQASGLSAARDTFLKWAQVRGVGWLDVGTLARTQDQYRDDIHPNAQGADMQAAFFADYVTTRATRCS